MAFAARTAIVTPSTVTTGGVLYTAAGAITNAGAFSFDGANLGIGSTTAVAVLQATASTSNATTSVEFGKLNQNKGTCITFFDTAGTAVYGFIATGATSFTYTTTKPSGCQS